MEIGHACPWRVPQQKSVIQLLAIQYSACHSHRKLRPELFTLHYPCLPAVLGQVPQSLQHDSFTPISLLAEQLSTCTSTGSLQSLESHISSSFKRVSMCSPHCSTKPWGTGSPCTQPPPKIQSLSQSGLTTSAITSDSFRQGFFLELSWMADMLLAMCVHGQTFLDSVYPPKPLLIRVGGSLCRTRIPALGGAGATKLHFLSSVLPSDADTSCRVFSLQLIKFLTRWCKASSVLLAFKN